MVLRLIFDTIRAIYLQILLFILVLNNQRKSNQYICFQRRNVYKEPNKGLLTF